MKKPNKQQQKPIDRQVTELFQAGRVIAMTTWPYFRQPLSMLVPTEPKGEVPEELLKGIPVDRYMRAYLTPRILQYTPEHVATLLRHGIEHPLRKHFERGSRSIVTDHEAWGASCECEVNDSHEEEFAELQKKHPGLGYPFVPMSPQAVGLPPGRFAEFYYTLFEREPEQSASGSGKADGGGGTATPPPPSQGRSPDASGPQGGSRTGSQGSPNSPRPTPEQSDCGSSSGPGDRPWEHDEPDSSPDVPAGTGQEEQDRMIQQVAEEVQNQAKSRGDIPAGLARWADAILRVQVDPQAVLNACVQRYLDSKRGKDDVTYARMSRRSSGAIIMPGSIDPVVDLLVAVDTSGSMDHTNVGLALGWIKSLVRRLDLDEGLHVVPVDADLYECQKVFKTEQIRLQGGGGTDMGLVVPLAEKLQPSCVIWITDGWTMWPEKGPRGVPAIIVLVDDEGSYRLPRWAARVIRVPKREAEDAA